MRQAYCIQTEEVMYRHLGVERHTTTLHTTPLIIIQGKFLGLGTIEEQPVHIVDYWGTLSIGARRSKAIRQAKNPDQRIIQMLTKSTLMHLIYK